MKFTIEPLQEGDYENILCKWWKDWRWTPPSKEFLPDNGLGGFMVYDDGVPVCAGFMYRTNSKAVWCDWIISNIEYKVLDRSQASVYPLTFIQYPQHQTDQYRSLTGPTRPCPWPRPSAQYFVCHLA